MKKNIDKQLDNLVSKMMNESSLESPSFDFTSQVMEQVDLLSQKRTMGYKPLISKPVWSVIVLAFLLSIAYLYFGFASQDSEPMFVINFDTVFNNRFTEALSSFNFSKTLMYAVLFFGMMVFIQIPILKNYFNRHLIQ